LSTRRLLLYNDEKILLILEQNKAPPREVKQLGLLYDDEKILLILEQNKAPPREVKEVWQIEENNSS